MQRDEHGVGLGVRVELAAAVLVALKRLQGTGLQRHLPRLAELRAAHHQHAIGDVDVIAVQAQRLADPQAGGREQPHQRLVGGGPQRLTDRAASGVHQPQHLVVCVDERRPPCPRDADQAGRRDLGARVDSGEVAREPADGRHPVAGDGAARWPVAVQRPRQCRRDGDVLVLAGVEMLDEPRQLAGGVVELVTEHPPQPQVIVQVAGQGAHDVAPGQGRATCRRRPRSTLA